MVSSSEKLKNAQIQTPNSTINRYRIGQTVEVKSEEEGFKGAWYTATIVKYIPASKNRQAEAEVEYHNLSTDADPSVRLKEQVDGSMIRPLPPKSNPDQCYEVNDVVDAYYIEGWWKGVVSKVDSFNRKQKYTVDFENSPDQHAFFSEELRFHSEWIDGSWVQCDKLKTMEGSSFAKGMDVEVNFEKEDLEDASSPIIANSNRSKEKEKEIPSKVITKFRAGEVVEVRSDDEGFVGAWYVATVLEYKSASRSRKAKASIRYHTLVTAYDENIPLEENVDGSNIRPLPPESNPDQCIEPFDVVDAFHRDGWWKGVVTKVDSFDGKKKYTVVFENPPEQIEFFSDDLRLHYEWINGAWVRSDKQVRMEGLNYSIGMTVEVKLDKYDLGDVWFPATILEEVGFNSFLIECFSPTPEGEVIQETVDSVHVRPKPPKYGVSSFEMLEVVDALYYSCWRKARINRALANEMYSVSISNISDAIPLHHSQIRPRFEFINGEWTDIFRNVIGRQYEGKTRHDNSDVTSPEVAVPGKNSVTATSDTGKSSQRKSSAKKDHHKQKLSHKRSRDSPLEQTTPPNSVSPRNNSQKTGSESEDTLSTLSKKLKKKHVVKHLEMPVPGGMLSKCSTKGLVCGLPSCGPGSPLKGKSDTDQGNVAPRKEVILSSEAANGLINSEATNHMLRAAEAETEVILEETLVARQPNEAGSSTMELKDSGTKQPGFSSSIGVEQEDVPIETSAPLENHKAKEVDLVVAETAELKNSQDWPFVKTLPVWAQIESSPVFQKYPQKPHFRPLINCRKTIREGTAVGHMFNFLKVVEQTSELRLFDEREVFDGHLEDLSDLEKHGFDVKAVKDHINNLLKVKDRLQQVKDKTESAHNKIEECKNEETKLQEDIDMIDRKIKELEEERAMKVTNKCMKSNKIIELDASAKDGNLAIVDIEREFELLAAAVL